MAIASMKPGILSASTVAEPSSFATERTFPFMAYRFPLDAVVAGDAAGLELQAAMKEAESIKIKKKTAEERRREWLLFMRNILHLSVFQRAVSVDVRTRNGAQTTWTLRAIASSEIYSGVRHRFRAGHCSETHRRSDCYQLKGDDWQNSGR